MGIDSFLLDGESAGKELEESGGLFGQDESWYVTSERVIKYGSGTLSNEEFHDISLNKIRGISFGRSRQNGLLAFGLLFIIPVVLLRFLPPEIISEFGILAIFQETPITIGGLFFGGIYIVLWLLSSYTYLQIHGSDSPDRWKIKSESIGSELSTKDLREFGIELREEISR